MKYQHTLRVNQWKEEFSCLYVYIYERCIYTHSEVTVWQTCNKQLKNNNNNINSSLSNLLTSLTTLLVAWEKHQTESSEWGIADCTSEWWNGRKWACISNPWFSACPSYFGCCKNMQAFFLNCLDLWVVLLLKCCLRVRAREQPFGHTWAQLSTGS